jgi:hypothetical protein
MDLSILRNIQFGVDIATSITILGALVSWLYNQRRNRIHEERRRELERQRGINDAARAVVTASVQGLIEGLSKGFNQIVTSSLAIESKVERSLDAGGVEAVAAMLDTGGVDLDKIEDQLAQVREHVSNFYESAATSRYLLIPSLYCLPEGEETIRTVKEDFRGVMTAHNRIAGGYVALISELKPLLTAASEVDPGLRDSEDFPGVFYKEHERAIDSIIFDKDYAAFVDAYVPAGREQEFHDFVASPGASFAEMDQTLLATVLSRFVCSLLSGPGKLMAHVLILVCKELRATRIECKQALVNLAAISCRVLSKDNSQPIDVIARELKSDKYFALESEIR